MKQKKISNALKILDIVIGFGFVGFFIALTIVKFNYKGMLSDDLGSMFDKTLIPFSVAALLAGLFILFQFWKVADEIGNDNSFSIENRNSFRNMGATGIFLAVIYVARIIVTIAMNTLSVFNAAYNVIMIFAGIIFFVMCICLSKLIENAYEVKRENELTI